MPSRAAISFWYSLYNLLLVAGLGLGLPVWALRRAMGRYKGQLRERFGGLPAGVRERFSGRPALWAHAASAGETASAAPLVRRLREAFPDHAIYFTVTSRYGKEMAQKQLGEVVDAVAYSPFDLPFCVGRVLRAVRPRLYMMVETDIWPNLVRKAKSGGASVVIASGHAREASFPRPFWRVVFSHVDVFFMQSELDATHIVARGAPAGRVVVAGNLKFDSIGAVVEDGRLAGLRKEFGVPEGVPLLVAGSTLAEDEGPVLDAIAALREETGLDLHAIVAPRRMERIAAVEQGCAERGLGAVRRTAGGPCAPVLILDTMGELASTYNLADVAYVGGGLTPEVGLHNLLEPLVCGVPVLFGPHHGKAHRIAAEFLRLGAGVEIADGPRGLLDAMRRVLTDREECRRLAAAGKRLLDAHKGAADRQGAAIAELLAS